MQDGYPCTSCGGQVRFSPESGALACPHCGNEQPIPPDNTPVEEHDLHEALATLGRGQSIDDEAVIEDSCKSCGATYTLEPPITSQECPFCGAPVVEEGRQATRIKPRSLLPFEVGRKKGRTLFDDWLGGLWFAPNDVTKYARQQDALKGVYTPYWTFDADTVTRWTGRRGDTYTVTDSEGKTKTRIRWTNVSGTLDMDFDDVLVVASENLPRSKTEKLEPWPTERLIPFNPAYLAGFVTEHYQVDLADADVQARQRMEREIESGIRRQIGGDQQQITSKSVNWRHQTFKHTLLPIWLSSFKYRDKIYRFVVNGVTGEVQGERPWSWIKITLAILGAAIVIGGGAYLIDYYQNQP